MKKVLTILLALGAFGLILSGCSSGGGEDKPAETTTGTTGETGTTTGG